MRPPDGGLGTRGAPFGVPAVARDRRDPRPDQLRARDKPPRVLDREQELAIAERGQPIRPVRPGRRAISGAAGQQPRTGGARDRGELPGRGGVGHPVHDHHVGELGQLRRGLRGRGGGEHRQPGTGAAGDQLE